MHKDFPLKATRELMGNKRDLLSPPKWTLHMDFFESRYWAIGVSEREGDRVFKRISTSGDGSNWQMESRLYFERGAIPSGIFPLRNGRYLLTSATAFVGDGVASPFSLAKQNDSREIIPDRVLDTGIELDFVAKAELNKPGPIRQVSPDGILPGIGPMFMDLGYRFVARWSDGVVFASGPTGLFWVLDDAGESPKLRKYQLFSAVNGDRLKRPQELEWAVLGCQPRPDGHILVASRSEDAVLRSRIHFPSGLETLKDFKDPEMQKKHQSNQEKALELFPEILWWDFNPRTGKFTKETPPEGIPEKIRDVKTLKSVRFRYKPDGNLLFAYN